MVVAALIQPAKIHLLFVYTKRFLIFLHKYAN